MWWTRGEAVDEVEDPATKGAPPRCLLEQHVGHCLLAEPLGTELQQLDGEVDAHHLPDVRRDDLGGVPGAARDVEHQHLGVKRSQLVMVPAGGARTVNRAREQPHLTGERTRTTSSGRSYGHCYSPTAWSSPRHRPTMWPYRSRCDPGSPVRAGAWPEDADDLVTPWHTHELHQLLYVFEGVAEVESAGARHSCAPAGRVDPGRAPPPDDLRRVRVGGGVLRAAMVDDRGDRCG